MGDGEFGISPAKIEEYAKDVQTIVALGCEVAIVIGGGNIFRGVQAANSGMDSFMIYTEPFVITGGGPGNSTTLLSIDLV